VALILVAYLVVAQTGPGRRRPLRGSTPGATKAG
jgi:hypothetical protein